MNQPVVILKPGREKSVLRKHPWIFSGAVHKVIGDPIEGETVAVHSSFDEFLAWGAYSSKSQIRIRIWDWNENVDINGDFLWNKLTQSITARTNWGVTQNSNSFRLVHAESDGLPGLIVDRYEDVLVIQILSCGCEFWKNELVNGLKEITGINDVYERSDVDARMLEGLSTRIGAISGKELIDPIKLQEWETFFEVDVIRGHKTGFYLDQRKNRKKIRDTANGYDVLDCFCYTGGFSLNALLGGAQSVVSIDSSSQALETLENNLKLNNLSSDRIDLVHGDVFQKLREFRDKNKSFDLIILDPPKFAQTTSQVDKAARGYKDINYIGFQTPSSGRAFIYIFLFRWD